MAICNASPFDIHDQCVRAVWAAFLPAALTYIIVAFSLPIPVPMFVRRAGRSVKSFFGGFLSLREAFILQGEPPSVVEVPSKPPLWKTFTLSSIGISEAIFWLAVSSYRIIVSENGKEIQVWSALSPFLIATTWLYASIRPVVRPPATPPYDLFILYLMHLVGAIISFVAIVYDHRISGIPFPGALTLLALAANFIAISTCLVIALGMPLSIPPLNVDKGKIGTTISPEDYTTLWGWISFSWVEPLIDRGTYTTLEENDVWELSPTLQSEPLFAKFRETKQKTLFRRLFIANALDLTLDFTLTFVSIVFDYASPYFLKRILDAIASPSPEARAQAYIYASLSFLCSLLKAQADAQHLWYGRRAATRIRSELMAAIYEKALRRKDFSGVTNKDITNPDQDHDTSTTKSKGPEPKAKTAGADIGKIVNLMSSDANRCAMMTTAGYMIYGAPFEIIIASAFLYQLLGWSAFVGLLVLLAAAPLNTIVSRRAVKISKSLSAARDSRMALLTELLGAIKFIKFFAWEPQWIKRVQESREKELGWLLKDRINSIMFALLWSVAPSLVSVISFWAFIAQGNQLTVAIAFTAIALFNMLRLPLNILPTFIVQILQAGVALDRISKFLDEEDVPDDVSSLKRVPNPNPKLDDERLGAVNATFRWNQPKQAPEGTDASKVVPPELANDIPEIDDDQRFQLSDISVIFPPGELTLITGPTASGKSALLLALLGEMTCLPGGTLYLPKNPSQVDQYGLTNSISYCAQTPWLEHKSIRENILFGYPFEEDRYQEVLERCALNPDLAILEDGDLTEIGARGVSLSGGQKARVALARAVYARTRHVLLDDVFAAVDSHTARLLFEGLLQGPLLAHRTVVLVTHHVELVLPATHYLVRLLDGRISNQGTVKELREQNLLDIIAHDAITKDAAPALVSTEQAIVDTVAEAIPAEPKSDVDIAAKKPRKLVKDEAKATGSVKWSIYKTYLEASSWWTWGVILLLIIVFQCIGIFEKVWIQIWGDAYRDRLAAAIAFLINSDLRSAAAPETSHHLAHDLSASPSYMTSRLIFSSGSADAPSTLSLPSANSQPMFYVAVYATIGIGAALLATVNTIVQYTGSFRASRILFTRLLNTVIRAPMRWFDTTPTGRILNRFSRDIETIDSSLSSSIRATSAYFAGFIAAILTVSFVLPAFLLPAVGICYVYYKLSLGYINTGRDLRRMESNSRSPIFSGFGELLDGIVTVRAFSAESRFFRSMHMKVDVTTRMWYSFWMLNRYLLLHFDALGALSIFLTTLFAISGYVSAGMAGLTITSAMAFTTSVYWTCRFITTLEMDSNAVERVVEYLDLVQEPPAIIESHRPPAYWPSTSDSDSLLVVEDLVIKYSPELEPVLHGVSFTLKARERVGLLGRTGSGKSTLAMALLRFVEPTEGRIIVDGIDITTIGLQDLRSRLTIIPQDAVLFSGTIRDNLDPFGEHEDVELNDALFRVQLISDSTHASRKSSRLPSRAPSIHEVDVNPDESQTPRIASSSASATTVVNGEEHKGKVTLETQVSPGGSNFSQGQRQLIAMARALLRQSSIIIMDEATSSIDFSTDSKIQSTIRDEFGSSLLITIAHRIRTVIDYDRLIVLDKGRIVEFDTPLNLIEKEDGVFREMCLKTGTFEELKAAASAKVPLRK